ncbi:hypothetical protein BH24ACT21_BH24ACT21_04790 [soil metagenome]
MRDNQYEVLAEALSSGIREGLQKTLTLDLAAAAKFSQVSEERMIQLATQGRVEAWQTPKGWLFNSVSLSILTTEQTLTQIRSSIGVQLADRLGENLAEEIVSLIEAIAEGQYVRGQLVGWQKSGEYIANLVDEHINEFREEENP